MKNEIKVCPKVFHNYFFVIYSRNSVLIHTLYTKLIICTQSTGPFQQRPHQNSPRERCRPPQQQTAGGWLWPPTRTPREGDSPGAEPSCLPRPTCSIFQDDN